MPQTLTIETLITPDQLACEIAERYQLWKSARATKETQWKEVRNYVFATDTTTTTNSKLPWRNTTTRPKLCQIRDNLHANYLAALFPTENWFRWIPGTQDAANQSKARAIESYMRAKLRECQFKEFVSRALYDYIDYGNAFGDVEFVKDVNTNDIGEEVVNYVGPRPIRVSPLDIVFDITAASFLRTPKITRRLLSYGDLVKQSKTMAPEDAEVYLKALERIKTNRATYLTSNQYDSDKVGAFIADGFSTLSQYYSTNLVELLTFEGDIYSPSTNVEYPNHRITVMDRAYVVEKRPISNWLGRSTLVHAGWRLRPDNLMAMGPLDNLVGLQYRIDHLENLKADVFDMIAYPMVKQSGYVEEWRYAPNEKIFMDTEANVDFLHPDVTALNADQQIYELQNQMEEMAGAPKQAMGIRTPGEKTAFEVQSLESAAGRIFEHKVAYFEEMFVEPILNGMLELARRHLDTADVVRVVSDDIGVATFITVTKQDISARGRLTPMGARHFATQNKLVQNLTQLTATGAYQDPSVMVHFSGWEMAKLLEDTLGLSNYNLVRQNVRVMEQAQTAQLQQAAQEQIMGTTMTPPTPEDDSDLTRQLGPQQGAPNAIQ